MIFSVCRPQFFIFSHNVSKFHTRKVSLGRLWEKANIHSKQNLN